MIEKMGDIKVRGKSREMLLICLPMRWTKSNLVSSAFLQIQVRGGILLTSRRFDRAVHELSHGDLPPEGIIDPRWKKMEKEMLEGELAEALR
jgi:hypothetical protein